MVTNADSRPGRDAYTRYAELKEQFDEVIVALGFRFGAPQR